MKRSIVGLALIVASGCGAVSTSKKDPGSDLLRGGGLPTSRVLVVSLPGPEGVRLEMRKIPAGTFLMGAAPSEKDREEDEGPLHQVAITRPFYMGIHEVTQAQWAAVMGTWPAHFGGKADHPVESVSWEDCQAFIARLNGLGLGTFRLPTEAEWEYACRAGTTTRFYWGDDPGGEEADRHAWCQGNSELATHPVGQKLPNPWGLFDMSGNVYEWCQDVFAPYAEVQQIDPQGAPSGMFRAVRGGSWFNYPATCRSAGRIEGFPEMRDNMVGLRLVREAR